MGQKPQQMFYLGKNLPRATLAQEKGPVLYLHKYVDKYDAERRNFGPGLLGLPS